MQEDSLQIPEEESTEKPDNHVEAKPLCNDHEPEHHSLQGQETEALGEQSSRMLEVKSDKEAVPGKKPVGEKKGKKAVGRKRLWWKKSAATKKPAAENPTENKPTTGEKKPVA